MFLPRIIYLATVCLFASFTSCQELSCVYYIQDSKVRLMQATELEESGDWDSEPYHTGELIDGNRTERCNSAKYCYSLWNVNRNNETVLMAQGCWNQDNFQCNSEACNSLSKPSTANNASTMFCCCNSSFCNANYSDGYVPKLEESPEYKDNAAYDTHTVIIVVTVMCSFAVIFVIVICIVYRNYSAPRKPSPDSVGLINPPPPSYNFNLENLKIAESIGRGRYGTVYRGSLFGQSVAVKLFSAAHRQNYLNERYIYFLPFMEHPSLPKLIGAEERMNADDRPEYLLVMTHAPQGCLQDFLINNTFDWSRFCKMATSITQGLAHLHMEIGKDDKQKMCVAHRDLTSRNILIKADGSCMICDFGFAICISGSKYYIRGEEQLAESTSLMDVGTFRYMAPEVLEGAVNLRDCESSLKQIDLYALGLIMWEMATRCTDLFQGVQVPGYRAPFAAEIGTHPTMEQLQHLVVKRKARPLFPDIWKDTNPAVRSLKETIEECWDQDAEARLTALCVEERLIELPILWDRHKAGATIQGVSPTVNPMSISNRNTAIEMPLMWSDSFSPTDRSFSNEFTGDTAETSVTISPTFPEPTNMKNLMANNINNNVTNLRVTVPLQPYHGKNPVMERNLVQQSIDEITISGNALVGRGDLPPRVFDLDSDIFDSLNPSPTERHALVPNEAPPPRPIHPIPYLQNAVRSAPKRPNVPGNGHSIPAAAGHGQKKSGLISGVKSFLGFSKNGALSQSQIKPPEPPTVIVPKLPVSDTLPKYTSSTDTEVYVMDPNDEFSMTQTIVRPVANRQVYSQTVPTDDGGSPDCGRLRKESNGDVHGRQQRGLDVARGEDTVTENIVANHTKLVNDLTTAATPAGAASPRSDFSNPRFSIGTDRIGTINDVSDQPCKTAAPSASAPLSIDSLCQSEVNSFNSEFRSRGSLPRQWED